VTVEGERRAGGSSGEETGGVGSGGRGGRRRSRVKLEWESGKSG